MNNYNERKRPRAPFNLDDFFGPHGFAGELETKISKVFNDLMKGLTMKKADSELVFSLDTPGVTKENVSVRFDELSYGFTRLAVTTNRDGKESAYKLEFREKVDASKAVASVKTGVLTIKVPLKMDDVESSTEVPIK